MVIENLPSLRIHRLSEAQYNKLVNDQTVDPKALYLVPDDGQDIDLVETLDNTVTHEQIPSAQATVEYVEQEIAAKAPEIMTDLSANLSDKKIPSAKATVAYVDAEIAALIGGEKYDKALDTINEISAAIGDNKDTMEILRAAITEKVNKEEFNEAMEDKVDVSTYNAAISDLQSGLNTKANSADLTTLDQKVTTTNQNLAALGNQKADTTYVDEQVANKATKDEVNSKVNQSTFDTSIGAINQALNSQTEKNTQIDGSINALDDKIDATNEEVAKKIGLSQITTNLSKDSTNDEVPGAKKVFDYVNASIVPDVVISPNIWTLDDGWHYVSSGFYAKEGYYIDIASEALVFVYSNDHKAEYCNFYGWERQGNTFTGSVTLASGGTEGTFTLRTPTTITVDGDVTSEFPTSKAVTDLIDEQIKYNAPDWIAVEGSPGYIKNKPFETTSSDSSIPDILIDESTITNKEKDETSGYIVVESWAQTDVTIIPRQEYTIIYTTYDGEEITSKATAKTGQEMGYDSDHPMVDVVILSDPTGGLAGYSIPEYFVCNYPDYYSKIEIYIGEPSRTTKIQYQYIETVNEITESTEGEEIPTVQAIRDFIQQEIENSLYIDEEDYV